MSGIAFGIISFVVLASALAVVFTENLVRGVFWLALGLLGTAALYALLDASFLAGVQVLTYVGGVVTLMIFGVMVTRRHDGGPIPSLGSDRFRSALVALGTFAAMSSAIVSSGLDAAAAPSPHVTLAALARSLVDERRYLLAFEAASVLLLAAIVGAVVIARRHDVANARVARVPLALRPAVKSAGGPVASSGAAPGLAARASAVPEAHP